MSNPIIITISRQFGSGGHEIGAKLAKELNVPFYDKELVELSAKQSGMSEEVFKGIDESATHSLLFSIATGAYVMGNRSTGYGELEVPLQDKLFLVETDIIKEIARNGSCVIVGRASDYILRDNPYCINVFIHTSLKNRINRISRIHKITEDKAEKLINKTDKRRVNYYNYYTDQKWGLAKNYHLSVDSGIGIDKCVSIIKSLVQ
ncbi:MAG: cytidylate kinaselike family protein [Clostridiales bacterium]|jgi:cytidylate kinase|nr:cytidylate kinaselike family protein [Clostridiales bacterium]